MGNKILLGYVIASISVIIFLFTSLRSMSEKYETSKKNFEAEIGYRDDIKDFTKKEFEKYYKFLRDSINEKNITEVHRVTINNHYHDTTIVELLPVDKDSTISMFTQPIKCFTVGGMINWNNKQLLINQIDYDNKIVIAEYLGKREKKKILFFNFRIGERIRELKAISSCGDSLEVEKINVIDEN